MTLKVVSESRVTWAISVPNLVFLGLSVLDLGPMYATDRQTSDVVRQKHRLMPPPIRGGGIINDFDRGVPKIFYWRAKTEW